MKNINDLVSFLNEKCLPPEEVVAVVETVNNLVSGKYYAELLNTLSKKEIEKINKTENDSNAEYLIKTKFLASTGKRPEEVLEKIINDVIGKFIDNYKKDAAVDKPLKTL